MNKRFKQFFCLLLLLVLTGCSASPAAASPAPTGKEIVAKYEKAQNEDYVLQMIHNSELIMDSNSTIWNLLEKITTTRYTQQDAENFADAVVTLESAVTQMEFTTPPASMKDAHETYVVTSMRLSKELDQMVEDLDGDFKRATSRYFDQCEKFSDALGVFMNQASDLVN